VLGILEGQLAKNKWLLGSESHLDADAELDAVIGQHAGVALRHPALHFDGAA